jgi:hypothetical protein
MANYVVSKLVKMESSAVAKRVDFKRRSFVLKETHCLEMRFRSHAPDSQQVSIHRVVYEG